MGAIKVKSSTNTYHVHVGEGFRYRLADFMTKTYSSIFIITDSQVAPLYLEEVREHLESENVFSYIVPAGEKSKSIEQYYALQTAALENGLDRESLIIALGGGVVGDLAGFVAATFMRGIDYIQVPTTILAHDSSVGGKVAINHEQGKNLIGCFYPPAAVVYDVATLETLSEQEKRSGYAELMKEALISDKKFYVELIGTSIHDVTPDLLSAHLEAGIKVKSHIVERDEHEAGERKFLNLGHTLGHAIEALKGYGSLTHGEAVAIGLLFAIHVSEKELNAILPFDEVCQWMKTNNYPIDLNDLEVQELINKMRTDKKTVNKQIQMVLLEAIETPVTAILTDQQIQEHYQSFKERVLMRV